MNSEDIVYAPKTRPENIETREVLFFDNAVQAVCAAAPKGARIRAIGFDSIDAFLRAGYRAVEDDADVVIARGGEREFERARAGAKEAKLILCPTHAFHAAASPRYRVQDDIFALTARGEKPFAAVFDASDMHRNAAAVFGGIVSLDLCAFDCYFGAKMRGEAADEDTACEIADIVTSLTDGMRPYCKSREKANILVEYGKRAARAVENCPALLHASGAAQAVEAVRMLYSAEDRPLGMRGETEMLLSRYVIDLYIKNLGSNELGFPPDNNRRIDSLCEYLKADVRRACVYVAPIYPPLKMRISEYRLEEYRNEFIVRLSELRHRNNAALQVFKRLYPDDGYCLKTLVDREDIPLCLALAPDVLHADSMLSFLKQTGRLEKYLI